MRLLVISPNWLGDAVMSIPAMHDLRCHFAPAELIVAARRSLSGLFALTSPVDRVVPLDASARWWRFGAMRSDASRLRDLGADAAVLLPNSFASAWLVSRAAIPERWGYAADHRRRLLTRAVPRPTGERHQAAYYQHLVQELGCEPGPLEPRLAVPDAAVDAARALLVERGWDPSRPLVAMAPGAAYGTAKQWIPAHVARFADMVVRQRNADCVLVGSRADAPATGVIRRTVSEDTRDRVFDLAGETSLETLAAVFTLAFACVANDSGAMHVAAAVGAPLIALFGPTREYETAPLPRGGRPADVITHPVWCRPCMLRECPIDHRCMTGIAPERVLAAMDRLAPAGASRR